MGLKKCIIGVMRFKIIIKKLEFLWHLLNLEDGALAKEILITQKLQKRPGLVQECEEWITNFNLPNVFEENLTKLQWKKAVKILEGLEGFENQNVKLS